MTNPLLEEVYRAREKLWQRAGGTMRGLGEYLMEYRRRADARGVKWIESEEELEAIGAEVRARLAAEAAGEAMCAGEPKVEYQTEGSGAGGQTGLLRNLEVDPVLSQVKEPDDWFGDESEEWEGEGRDTGTLGHRDAGTPGREECGAGREGEGDGFAITDTHD